MTKQYMTFEMTTISIMYSLSQMFDEFYLCKPYTSREANSETFLVGKGFKGGYDINHPYKVNSGHHFDSPKWSVYRSMNFGISRLQANFTHLLFAKIIIILFKPLYGVF